jgi:hypothetical protein
MACGSTAGKEVSKMAGKKVHRPGQIADTSGQYGVVGPRGGDKGREVTVTRGEPFPPTPEPGQGFVINDKTRHSPKKEK